MVPFTQAKECQREFRLSGILYLSSPGLGDVLASRQTIMAERVAPVRKLFFLWLVGLSLLPADARLHSR